MGKQITLTSRLGSFTFESDVILSHAKIIRDTVTGQFFSPKPGEPKLDDENSIYSFIRNHPSIIIAPIPFEIFINPLPKC